jgi:hypothetical protein
MIVKLTGRQWLWMMRADDFRAGGGGGGGGAAGKAAGKFRAERLLVFSKHSSDPSGYLCQDPRIHSTHY